MSSKQLFFNKNLFWTATLLLIVNIIACNNSSPKSTGGEATLLARGIVGGVVETGWPAVGALIGLTDKLFCTGTLIDPNWALTAAHCVDDDSTGMRFFFGNDAGDLSSGEVYEVAAFIPHPDWIGGAINDIGLVQLSTAVPSSVALPMIINTTGMDQSWIGSDVLYVGFGSIEDYGALDNELKRSANNDIAYVGVEYTSMYDGSLVCSGDSGGPGILEVDGTNVIIGVNSSVGNIESEDPCHGASHHTRTDVYLDWIYGHVGDGATPNCNDDSALCFCADACQADGSCDNELCHAGNCEWIYNCIGDCKPLVLSCRDTCRFLATDNALIEAESIINCYTENCSEFTNTLEWFECVATKCEDEVSTCFDLDMCDLVGGDCSANETCRPATMRQSNCIATQGIGYGEACEGTNGFLSECVDGHICLNSSAEGYLCHNICRADSDCVDGNCKDSLFSSIHWDMTVGYCKDDFSKTDVDTDTDSEVADAGDVDSDSETNSTDNDAGEIDSDSIPEPKTNPVNGSDGCGCTQPGIKTERSFLFRT